MSFAESLPELRLQRLLRVVLSDPARLWRDEVSGVAVQILSLGEWNRAEGPDFLNAAIVAEGRLRVGAVEAHRKSSDWRAHGHHRNAAYDDVLLHVVLKNDSNERFARYTIVAPGAEIERASEREAFGREAFAAETAGSFSGDRPPGEAALRAALETVEECALRRLSRKSVEAERLLREFEPSVAARTLAERFAAKWRARTRRPHGALADGAALASAWERRFEAFARSACSAPSALLDELARQPIANEGASARAEFVTNVALPLVWALCDAARRAQMLEWYWTFPARNRYGALRRRFPAIPQRCAWQQQGLLEYLAELQPARRNAEEVASALGAAPKGYSFTLVLYFPEL